LLFLLLATPPPHASDDDTDALESIGDVLQVALPAGGFLSTFLVGNGEGGRWDRQGTWQSAAAFAASWTTTYAWKATAQKLRPNGHANNSYPSGHTMGAFSGAVFIDRRYGRTFGIPAYALAALTAYSRVASDWHFADDTVAGASVSLLWGAAIVTPQPWHTNIRPFFADGNTGLLLSVGGTPRPTPEQLEQPSPWEYSFFFGPAFVINNNVAAPGDGGTEFDLAVFQKQDDPVSTAAAQISYRATDTNRFDLFYNPYEARDQGSFTEPVQFAGVTFPADSLVQSAWRLHDVRIRWRHRLLDAKWMADGGAGLMLQDTYVALSTDSLSASVEDVALLPYLTASLGYRVVPELLVGVQGDATALSDDWMLDLAAVVQWRFHPRWKVQGGYQYYAREIATSQIYNKVGYNVPFLAVAASW
jgi:hypothetical protein